MEKIIKSMKGIFALLLAGAMLTSMAACTSKNSETASLTPKEDEPTYSPESFYRTLCDTEQMTVGVAVDSVYPSETVYLAATYEYDDMKVKEHYKEVVTGGFSPREADLTVYYDLANQQYCEKSADEDEWFTSGFYPEDWEEFFNVVLIDNSYDFFADGNYEQKDGKFILTEEAVANLHQAILANDPEGSIAAFYGDLFDLNAVFEPTDDGAFLNVSIKGSDVKTNAVYTFRFTETSVTLPEEMLESEDEDRQAETEAPETLAASKADASDEEQEIYLPSQLEMAFLRLINEERRKVGLGELTFDLEIYECAKIRAEETIERWSHTRPDGSKYKSVYEACGFELPHWTSENLGKRFVEVESMMDALMNSEGHRINILFDKFDAVCIAVVLNEETGLYHVAQLFNGA